MGFFRQEYWNGLPFPPPGDPPDPGIEHMSPALAGRFLTTEPLEEAVQCLEDGKYSTDVSYNYGCVQKALTGPLGC